MKYVAGLLVAFGLSGFVMPMVMRDPPFWDGLNNDAPLFAGIVTGVGILLFALAFLVGRKKRKNP